MSDHSSDLTTVVEGSDGIRVIRGGGNVRAWNGIHDKTGLSAKNVGAHIVAYDRRTGRPARTDAPIGNA